MEVGGGEDQNGTSPSTSIGASTDQRIRFEVSEHSTEHTGSKGKREKLSGR